MRIVLHSEAFERATRSEADIFVCLQPLSSKDGEVLGKFSQFGTRVTLQLPHEAGSARYGQSFVASRYDPAKVTDLGKLSITQMKNGISVTVICISTTSFGTGDAFHAKTPLVRCILFFQLFCYLYYLLILLTLHSYEVVQEHTHHIVWTGVGPCIPWFPFVKVTFQKPTSSTKPISDHFTILNGTLTTFLTIWTSKGGLIVGEALRTWGVTLTVSGHCVTESGDDNRYHLVVK